MPNDISTFIKHKTDADVYNVGFGGCRMTAHPTATYDAFCMYNLANAIANNDFSKQDTAMQTLSNNNFKRNLATLKSIDFSKVDIITISYGTFIFITVSCLFRCCSK